MTITPYAKNAKKHPDEQLRHIALSLQEYGWRQPIVTDKSGEIIVGHGRYMAYQKYPDNIKEPWIVIADDLTPEQVRGYRLMDNKTNESDWDMALVIEELKELDSLGFDITLTGFDSDLLAEQYRNGVKNSLQEAYIVPPFSIWDTKQEYWQSRKRQWIDYIGYSGDGRDDDLMGAGLKKLAQGTSLTGTSIFDPVVAELSYRWFCPKDGTILDPFAGGHVRGATAALLGYDYTGIDLSSRQIIVNEDKLKSLKLNARYINGDSSNVDTLVEGEYDFIFSCPPYFDLEEYNDGEGDLSMQDDYQGFLSLYKEIIKKSVDKLKENRFAVFVVGDVRSKDGGYHGLVKDTIDAFTSTGMVLYNEIILANAIATAPLRAKRPFDSSRKVTKVHQNVLCFYKGDVNEMKQWYAAMPQIHKTHQNVLVFYKGDIDKIQENYKAVNKDIDYGIE